jgi:hypothetical protein
MIVGMSKLEQHHQEIITRYQAGESCAKIGETYGSWPKAIHDLLKRHGVATRPTGHHGAGLATFHGFTDAQNKEMIAAYTGGASLQELADKHEVVVTTIRKRLLALGVTMRKAGPLTPEVKGDEIRCSACKDFKHFSLFDKHPKNSTGRLSSCKECEIKRYRIRMYGVTSEAYEALVETHGGQCAICKCTAEHPRNHGLKSLAIDHCHTSGSVRGLLCHSCNTALGKFDDNISFLQGAISYLRTANEKTPAV